MWNLNQAHFSWGCVCVLPGSIFVLPYVSSCLASTCSLSTISLLAMFYLLVQEVLRLLSRNSQIEVVNEDGWLVCLFDWGFVVLVFSFVLWKSACSINTPVQDTCRQQQWRWRFPLQREPAGSCAGDTELCPSSRVTHFKAHTLMSLYGNMKGEWGASVRNCLYLGCSV